MAIVQDWQYEPDLTREERAIMFRHIAIAALCCPIYMVAPVVFGLLMGPYVMWMVFASRPALLLPLIIHMIYGSQQRYLVLLACFIYALMHVNIIAKRGILWIYVPYLLLFPFFIWYTITRYRLFGGGIGAGGTFEGLGYYLGISAFFWGFLAIGRIPPTVMKGFVIMCFADVMLHFLFFMSIPFTRFLFWALPFLVVFGFWIVLKNNKITKSRWKVISMCSLTIMILGFLGISEMRTTFTLIGTAAIAIIHLVITKYAPRALWMFAPIVILPLMTIWMFHTMDKWYVEERGHGSSIAYNDIHVYDWESLKYKLFRKTMNDRAPVWYSSWEAVKAQFRRDPIWIDVMPTYGGFTVDNMSGHSREIILEIAAHNMFLEMLRLYGLYGGLGLYIVFLALPSMGIIRESLRNHIATPYSPILACCIAQIIVGGQTGQYPISPQFTLYLFGLMGICAGNRTDDDEYESDQQTSIIAPTHPVGLQN